MAKLLLKNFHAETSPLSARGPPKTRLTDHDGPFATETPEIENPDPITEEGSIRTGKWRPSDSHREEIN